MPLVKLPARSPAVPFRRVALSEPRAETQIQRGLYTVQRGERLAIPADRLREPTVYLNRDLWRQDEHGRVFRPGVQFRPTRFTFQYKALAWLRDHVDQRIPYWYYLATLGHDVHITTWGELYARHWHQGWANPFAPDRLDLPLDPTFDTLARTHPDWPLPLGAVGFVEDLGWLRSAKVTDAFISEEIDELVSAAGTEYADFDYHEVGTSSQVENNNDVALIATSGIARATGTPTDSDPIYQSVGTITADVTESWEEHGLFNNTTGVALMDRSLTGGQAVNLNDQVQYTYQLTKNPEA